MNGRYASCPVCGRVCRVTVCWRVAGHGCAGDLEPVTRDVSGCFVPVGIVTLR